MAKSFCILLLFIYILSCTTEKPNCCNDSFQAGAYDSIPRNTLVSSDSFSTSHLKIFLNKNGYYLNFGMHFFKKDDSPYIAFMNGTKDSIVFINLTDSNKLFIRSVSHLLNGHNSNTRFHTGLVNDTMHIIETIFNTKDGNRLFYKQLIITDSLTIKKIKSIEISSMISDKEQISLKTNTAMGGILTCQNGKIIIGYSKFNWKNNDRGERVLKVINIPENKSTSLMKLPQKYIDCDVYPSMTPMVLNMTKEVLIVGFNQSDKLYKVNSQTELIEEGQETTFRNHFMCFDIANWSNLAYTHKISLLNETNVNLLKVNNNLYLIKRLRRLEKSEPEHCAIVEFNNQLQQLNTYFLKEVVNPSFSFEFNNKLIFIDNAIQKAYTYEFSKE